MILADSNGISIWRILVTILTVPMKLIFGIMPDVEIPFFSDASTTTAQAIGAKMAVINSFFPVTEALQVLAFVLAVVFPVAATYTIANWVWRHIPTIFGVGTGAG